MESEPTASECVSVQKVTVPTPPLPETAISQFGEAETPNHIQQIISSTLISTARILTSTNVEENLEDLTIVWLDANIILYTSNDSVDTIAQLQKIANFVKVFLDADECLDYVRSLENEKILLVTSGALGKIITPLIYELPQIANIYVFCGKKDNHQQWASHFKKIRGVYDDKAALIAIIGADARIFIKNLVPMSIFTDGNESSIRDLDKDSAAFMWHKLLLDIILRMPSTDNDKTNMLELCRTYYRNKEVELKFIDEFDRSFTPEHAVYWYTRDAFVYRIINKSLRGGDIEVIFAMRFFIKALHEQLRYEYMRTSTYAYIDILHERINKVYRGQLMGVNEIQKRGADVCRRLQRRPVGAVFRINSVEFFDECYNVHLTLTSDEIPRVKALVAHLNGESDDESPILTMGNYLAEMGELGKADNFYRLLLRDLPQDHKDIAPIYNNIGWLHYERGRYIYSLKNYEKALNILKTSSNPNNEVLSSILNNMGMVYYEKGDYNEATNKYEQSLELKLSTVPQNFSSIAKTYNNIGLVYLKRKSRAMALKNFNDALDIQTRHLPPNHHDFALTLNNIGCVHLSKEENEAALKKFKDALEIQKVSLPADHVDFATTYNNLGLVYDKLGDLSLSLENYRLSLNFRLKRLSPNHPDLGVAYNNIGLIYKKMNDYQRALEFCEKAYEIAKASSVTSQSNMNIYLSNIETVKRFR
ncbi:unnamed protein product [Didymodactylos carnosus]|uniref:Uncharacterized protein n=1 Tax=Didymodactylos carnosus TaxID=1234261 RepID=A0A815IMM9_9BILA|nr:unnamed protein product [Didymodactylos carnosus]CAF4256427.1 unnamed protein product [Didymodactylos carnosus]